MDFDYGKKKNMKVYNSEEPPSYAVSDGAKAGVPIALYVGKDDQLVKLNDG